jgi:hypothetical protein
MAKKWSDVAASAAFQALSFEEQEEARRQYFEQIIAPQVPEEDISLARDQFFADTTRSAGGGRGFINPPMAGQPQPTYPKLRPAPAPATDYSDMATAMQGTPMSRPQPAAPAPAPAKPPPYKNRLEALDDAVNLVEEGADFKKVAQAFSQIGIGEGDIMSHGKARKSPMFDLPEMSRKQIDQYVKPQPQPMPEPTGTITAVEPTALQEIGNTFKRGSLQAGQILDNLSFKAGIFDASTTAERMRERNRQMGAAAPSGDVAEGLERLQAANETGDYGTVAREVLDPSNWKALAALVAESAVASSPAIAATVGGTLVAGPFGAAGATALTSFTMEYGAAVGDVLEKRKVNLADPVAVRRTLEDPEFIAETRERGLKRGVPIAAFDALSAGFAGRFVKTVERAVESGAIAAKSAPRAFTVAGLKEGGLQVGAGMAGEATGQVATGENKPLDVLIEGLAELPGGVAEVGGNLYSSRNRTPEGMIASAISGAPGYKQRDVDARAASEFAAPLPTISTQVPPVGQPQTANFTPTDSPTKQAGLVDIVVPLPGAAGAPALGDLNVGTTGVPGGLAGAGGEAGGGLIDGSMGAAGPGDAGAPGLGGRTAPIPGVNDRQAVPAGGAAGQQPAGLARPFNRASDADLLARTEAAIGGEPLTWTGRGKTGYANEQDAQQAMATASTVIDTRQTHDWRVEPMDNGRFQIVGYQKETNLGTQTPQAQQGQTQGAAPAIQMAGAAQGGAGGIPAATGTPLELSDTERAGLKLAPTAPLRELSSLNKQLDQQLGVTFSPVKSTDLNDSQRLASAVARLMGKTLTVVHQETGAGALPNGMINTVGGKHLFVADDADDAPLAITVHEAYHGLPEAQRKSLNTALLDLFRQDRKDKFLDEFSYTPDKFEEEAPAMMVQAISKREDFWQELRTKMGNKEFGEVAKTIITKLGDIITGAKKQYGEDFVNKYISDVSKARDLLTTAYADAMKAQGLQPDMEVSGSGQATESMAASERAQPVVFDLPQTLFNPQTEAERRQGFANRFNNPVTLADGTRLSGFTDPVRQTTFYGYDKSGERFTINRDAIRPEDVVSSRDGNRTAEILRAGLVEVQNPAAPMASERSRIGMNFKDVIKRTPELQEGMAKLQAGEITKADYDKLVNEYKPVEPYQSVPEPVTTEAAKFALANGKGQSEEKAAKFGLPSQEFKAGEVAQLRLDIPSYSEHGAWVVSVHRPEGRSFSAGKVIGYEPVASVTNAEFGMLEKSAAKIAAGSAKGTIATIMGDWKPTTAAEAKLKADQALKSKDWVQVGMDPERHSYFYDRSSMEPVTAADEVIQIGPLVLAKNPTYGQKSEFMFSGRAREPVKVSDYNPKADNFNNQRDMASLLSESVPAETVAAADGFVEKYFKERQPVSVSPQDRLRAEILLKPRMEAAEQVKPEYDQKILNIAARTGATGQMLAPIKGIKRAAEKLALEENYQVDNIKDLLRSTIVVDSYAEAPAIIDEIRKEFDVVRIKDRAGAGVTGDKVEASDRQKFGGYADVLINIRMPNGTVGEIQINTPAMLAAKDGQGHKLYEAAREQPEGSPLRGEIYDAMRGLYDAAFSAANLRQPSAQDRNAASDIGAPRAGSELTATSSSPESASLKILPSGKATNSSPENEATNSQPGGKEEGTFIGSPDESSISQPLYTKPPRRGAERIGSFDVRTMKDGSIVVYGDSQNIRSQIPEDVKGRVTKDGYLFTNAAAPRVKAALEGRKTAYSRGGQVTEKLPMKDGKYLGAPEKYNTPGKIAALRKQLRMLTLEGERGRYWYENSSLAILRMTGGNVQEARKFVALLAIYSPQARVDSNSTFALRAWAQYKAGQPISVKTGVQDKKATQAMADVDAFWSGEKTGNFFFNLLREIDTSTAGKQGATIDMWMMRAAEYANDAPTATQYAFMENETNRIAQEMGWEPQQVQAAIWVAMKARMENKGVKQRTEATSEKKGWIKFERDAKGKKVRVIIDAQKHRDNWLKHAMEHVPTKEDTEQAKFDFADGVGRHIGQLSFEARPGRSTGVLDGIHTAPYAQQVEFQQAVQRAFYDENGTDMLAAQLGLLTEPSDIMRPGVWQGEVSPSTQKRVAMAPAGGDAGKTNVDPAQAELLNVYASVAGLVARQEGVGWHRPFYAGTKGQSNGLDIDIGRALNPTETKDLEAAIGKWMDEKKHANWQNQFALISSPTGIRVVNFGIITNAVLQSDIVKVAEGVLPDGSVRVFASSGDMPTNDWEANPNGQTYVQRIGAAGRSDVLDWARSVLAPRVQRVFEDFAEKYQWGDPGRIQFSNRGGSDAAGGGRDRGVGPQDVQAVTPSYGTPRKGAASAVGYHYSTQPRTTLDSVMYGTGLRGAEMARLQGADPRLKQRIYFYIDRGTGINPEAGVGGQAHLVNLQNLYDVDEDALRLRRDNESFNDFESAVIDAGFDGYMVRDAGPSGNAVLLGRHAVPVEQLGARSRMAGEPVAPARERVLSDAEKISANKMLPAGQVSGKRWAELISRSMPEVYERLAGSPVWQSDKVMYRGELARELRAQPMFSNRQLPKVSPQSALDADIKVASESLQRYIRAAEQGRQLPKLTIGRLPHVLNMLGARTQDFDIATSIVTKVFVRTKAEKGHADELPDITPKQLIEGIYRPAMVLKSKDGNPREFELVLPITSDKGALIVPIKVSVDNTDPTGAVLSIYAKGVSISGGKPNEQVLMKRINDGNLLYLDPGLAKQALTGRKAGDPKADVKLNGNFVSWPGVWPKLAEMISARTVKTDINLMGWIGKYYTPSSSPQGWEDAPAFSQRARAEDKEVASLFRDLQDARGLGRVRALERVDAHPMAETIRRIDQEFMDILERLDDAGLVKINCK